MARCELHGGHRCGNKTGMVARPVLVVDDDPDNRALIGHLLSSEGYAVATARDGREALKRLLDLRPAVILLDLEMPVMDGRSFRQHQLRLAGPLRSIPVIVCSGADEADKLKDELRPFTCLSKPFPDFTRLLERVEAAYLLASQSSFGVHLVSRHEPDISNSRWTASSSGLRCSREFLHPSHPTHQWVPTGENLGHQTFIPRLNRPQVAEGRCSCARSYKSDFGRSSVREERFVETSSFSWMALAANRQPGRRPAADRKVMWGRGLSRWTFLPLQATLCVLPVTGERARSLDQGSSRDGPFRHDARSHRRSAVGRRSGHRAGLAAGLRRRTRGRLGAEDRTSRTRRAACGVGSGRGVRSHRPGNDRPHQPAVLLVGSVADSVVRDVSATGTHRA